MIAVVSGSIPKSYAALWRPLYINEDESRVHYIAVSDGKYNLPPWRDWTVMRDGRTSSRRDHIYYKLQTHVYLNDYDHIVWHDGCFQLKADPVDLVELMGDGTLMFGRHPWRNCLYEEAEECVHHRPESAEGLAEQIARYREEGYPEGNGLIASSFYVRDNKDPGTCELFDLWLYEVMTGCCRTQVSFNYCAWKLGMTYKTLDINWGENEYYGRDPVRNRSRETT